MARFALSALVALVSLTLVAGQSTTAAAATGVPTFPATPLVSQIYPYTALVRFLLFIIHRFSLLTFSRSAPRSFSHSNCPRVTIRLQ